MFLSRLVLNPRVYAARRDLASAYQLHASLCRGFASDSASSRFLWRLEPLDKRTLPTVLVQSETCPGWQGFDSEHFEGYLAEAPESKEFTLTALNPGQLLRFRLRANPTVTQFDPVANKNKRRGLRDADKQLAWLNRQGERGGFTVLSATILQSDRLRAFKHEGGKPITLDAALFEGQLRVSDPEQLSSVVAQGVGPAKALGFGLLSVARGS